MDTMKITKKQAEIILTLDHAYDTNRRREAFKHLMARFNLTEETVVNEHMLLIGRLKRGIKLQSKHYTFYPEIYTKGD